MRRRGPGARAVVPPATRERPEGVVNGDLRDGDRVGAVVQHRTGRSPRGRSTTRSTIESARPAARPETAGARPAPCGRSANRSAASNASGASDHQPARQARRRRARSQVSLRTLPASKRPIHPSSANSLWCAWNMNVPGSGSASRESRAPPGTASACRCFSAHAPCRAGAIRVEEHAVQVEAVDQIELGHVDE